MMGLIIGFAMFVGMLIGIIITIAFLVFALVKTRKVSQERIHAWSFFFAGFAIILSVQLFALPYIPFPQTKPGSDYDIIMMMFFFKGVLYALTPGIAALIGFVLTRFCPEKPE